MTGPELTTAIVIGALVGLFVVALGYGQMVWLSRQKHAGEVAAAGSWSRAATWSVFGLLAAAVFCVLRAVTGAALRDQQAFLIGQDLFSVRPRPGLAARYEGHEVNVHRGDVLLRFTGQDGEEPREAMQGQLRLLAGELEIERTRPLEFDPELAREGEVAKTALREREQRLKQLVSERDAITREVTQQRLAIANRQFRVEQDDRAAERELAPLQASLATEREAKRSQDELLRQGIISHMEAARAQDALTQLEGRVGQLQDQRALLAQERQEIAGLRSSSERNFASQLQARTAEIERLGAEIEAARKAVDATGSALEQDRPRAESLRQKKLRQIEIRIEEANAALEGRGRSPTVEAPWDGRIGFREPSPSSAPADNGPLLVLYRSGSIGVTVHLDPGEVGSTDQDLRAELQVPTGLEGLQGVAGDSLLPGTVLARTRQPDGSAEVRIACDPPDRVVRQLAMGGSVPVVAHLRRGITGTRSFRAGLVLGLLALAVAGHAARRRGAGRAGTGREGNDRGPWDGPGVAPVIPGGPGFLPRLHSLPGEPDALRHAKAAPGALAILPTLVRRTRGDGSPGLRAEADHPPRDELSVLPRLGLELRVQIEAGAVAPGLVRRVSEALERSGHRAAVLVGVGFGELDDRGAIERAAIGLLAGAGGGALADATRDCAELLRIVSAIRSERMNGTLDRLRAHLVTAALDATRRDGAAGDASPALVKPLVEG